MSANPASPDTLVTTKPVTTQPDTIWPDTSAVLSKEPGLGEPAIDPVGGVGGIIRGIAKKGLLPVVKEVVDSVRDDLIVETARKLKEWWKEKTAEEPEAETEEKKKK